VAAPKSFRNPFIFFKDLTQKKGESCYIILHQIDFAGKSESILEALEMEEIYK
jgi:hypothetical protein